ncbi:polycomb group protein Psc [Parasteatoda tepidariorum]|uniref:polycomb group protein Psc n=1 Tax=Parasteatoda tepidariorum TaxID=114398 RepID=UPI00077FDF0C|nr:polycomb group protein Psc [Parasteatoda tepidariorum]XP_042905736.1 polycomb group protein Psc [Parasteatoda tepidariorum]
MHRPTRLKVTDINKQFICVLCDGYLIDATTVVECLHSFCRTCIVHYLENSRFCPVCEVQVHKTKPLSSIRSDVTLQDIVYKLVPGLYQNEMQRRREFYSAHPEAAAKCSSEERGEGAEQRCFYSPQETISLSLEYMHSSKDAVENDKEGSNKKDPMTRYLNCPAALSVANLKKFIRQKFGVSSSYSIEIFYGDNLLIDEYTLMDIAYIHTWRRAGPMKFFYSIMTSSPRTNYEVLKVLPEIKDELTTVPVPNVVPVSEETDTSIKVSEDSMKMEVDESPSTESNTPCNEIGGVEVKSYEVSTSLCSTSAVQKMEVVESDTPVQNVNNTSPENLPVTSKVELLPQSIQILTTPQHTVITSANSLKMKFVAGPKPKPLWKTVNAKKLKREARNKPAPRLARLAPYPPPATAPPTCLTATPLSQLTVGKLVPNVMPSLAPSLVTALVSTTANSLCSSSPNANLQPSTQFLGQVTTCNVVTCNVTTFSNSFSPSTNFPQKNFTTSSTDTKLTTSVPNSSFISTLPSSHVIAIPAAVRSPVNILPNVNNLPTIEVTSANVKPPIPHVSITNGSYSVPVSSSISTGIIDQVECNSIKAQMNSLPNTVLSSSAPSIPVISVLSDSSASMRESSKNGLSVPRNSSKSPSPNSTPPSAAEVDDKTSDTSEKSSLKMLLTCDKSSDKKETANNDNINSLENDKASTIKPSENAKNSSPHTPLTNGSCESFPLSTKTPETFDKKEKSSLSADFSDNDDLGCQADLVVDEHKMDSSDNEDESDVALREKITAIAEKEDDADDTEADSGRASDMSNQARSSCDDDIGSPTPTSLSEPDRKPATATTTSTNSILPSFTLPVNSSSTTTENSNRSAKSNNINHVINNLYRNHEKKDNIGALDLSTSCVRKAGEVAGARPKPVANPVLDTKHKQPSYLGAASKQHTACPPPPKPPTSSILMQGLTSRTPLVPSQLHGKPPHIPVSTFLGPPSFFSSQNRTVSTTSVTTGRSTPTYNASRTASSPVPISHSALSLLPVSPGSSQIMPGIPYPPCVPNPMAFPYRTPVTIPHHKGISSPPSTSIHSKTSSKQSNSRKSSLDSHHTKSLTSPNSRNGALGVASPATQASYPKTSPSNARMSPLASTAPSPKSMMPGALPNTPSYKPSQPLSPKSIMPSSLPNTSSYKSSQSPIYKKSYKSYNSKFKGSNLTVLNPGDPDHNGYSPKLVIKNLNVKPNNNNNNSNHHHHHHHSSPK